MQQLLFTIPGLNIPVYGFGAMLFLAIYSCVLWGSRRGKPLGLSKDNMVDLAFIFLLTGISGARIFYMIQFQKEFKFDGILGTVAEFVRIDQGGIVFYGCLIGGFFGFMFFRHIVLKKLKITTWQFADVLAPLLALGLAIGRIGCYLNSCCWGQVAVPECQTVPLAGAMCKFPMLPAQAKEQLISTSSRNDGRPHCYGMQTATGIVTRVLSSVDQRTYIKAVEPGSEAAAAGLLAGDRITKVNGVENANLLIFNSTKSTTEKMAQELKPFGNIESIKPEKEPGIFGCNQKNDNSDDWQLIVSLKDEASAIAARKKVEGLRTPDDHFWLADRYIEFNENIPRGQMTLSLEVEREGKVIPVSFKPKTVTVFPTQIYETISMILLILVMITYEPFKKHHGQLFVLYLIGYGLHRFINEMIRVEPTYKLVGVDVGLTASQIISLGFILGGIILELVLRSLHKKGKLNYA